MSEPREVGIARSADPAADAAAVDLGRYYRRHAPLYDATRWSFLFGRAALIRSVALHRRPRRILEAGCGTGANLLRLGRWFPDAEITGLDLSADMLARARRKLAAYRLPATLVRGRYDRPLDPRGFDLVLFSYCLSMIEPGWERALDAALGDLRPGGAVAVVDFHDTPNAGFRRWMARNHVRMDAHLLPRLNARCRPIAQTVRVAYGGGWRYFTFLGSPLTG